MARVLRSLRVATAAAAAVVASWLVAASAQAQLTFSLEGAGGWPNQAHYNAAVAAIQSSVNRYNAYGNFNSTNNHVYVYYEPGIPTAQANYGGSIGFGGTYPNERVMMHELAHFLGLPSGAWGGWMSDGLWDGARGNALVRQFEGEQATLNGDGAHFWPYGLNYDSEGSEINKQRQVAVVYAMRADLGIGSAANPATATSVTLTASDPFGTSGFNYKDQWSDGYFAHAGADYSTGDHTLRTPASGNSFTFAGDSLTVNNTTGTSGGLLYKGTGASGVITIDDLRLDGGWIQHANGIADVFQLDGTLNVISDSVIRAKQGDINILADVIGSGDITIELTDSPEVNDRYVRFVSSENEFAGNLVNLSRFQLAPGANFEFKIGAPGVNNEISGPTARNTLLSGDFVFDVSDAEYELGNSWQLVSASNATYGATFDVPGYFNDGGLWTNGAYAFDPATGVLAVAPEADLNNDGQINLSDWTTFVANHLTDLSGYAPEERLARGDLNRDGDSDFEDFRAFGLQYDAVNGDGAFAAIANLVVPEPASARLAFGIVALGFQVVRRRRS